MTTLPFILICFYLRCNFLKFFICSSKQTLGGSQNRNFASVETDAPCQLLKVINSSTSQSKAVFVFVLQVENFFYFRIWIILRKIFQMWQICGGGGHIQAGDCFSLHHCEKLAAQLYHLYQLGSKEKHLT